jgi:hypothetical protein
MKDKDFCTVRREVQHMNIPVGNSKFIRPERKRKRFRYRWLSDTTGFQILFNGNWENAQSIDFEFD